MKIKTILVVEDNELNIGIAVYPSGADSMDLLIDQAKNELAKSKNEIHPPTDVT